MDRWWFLAIPLVFLAGCGFPAAKVDEAKGHVKAALDKWQAGGKSEELKAQSPPVEFYEALWTAGEKLESFEMDEVKYVEAEKVVRCNVRLTLRNKKGKTHTEGVTYDVILGQPVKIVNNPMP